MKYAWHVFKYILVFVINLLILLFVHSYFNFIVMILMIVLPVVSIVCTFVLSRHLTVKFGGGEQNLTVDSPFLVSVVLDNSSIIPNMNTEIEISMENDLFHTNGRHTLCIPAYSRSANVVDYQIAQSYVGALEVKADRICVTDWLGFVRIKSKCNSVKEYKVFPSGKVDVEADMTAVSQGMNESEESRKKVMISPRLWM